MMKLTLPQQDVYFEQLLYPKDPIYNIGAKIEIKGEISYKVLNEAYVKLIDQHDSYRSMIASNNNEVYVEIVTEHKSVLGFKDFSKKEDPIAEANDFMETKFSNTFDLTKKQLLQEFVLIKVKKNMYYLFSMYHHIITDGWGTSLMFQRLVANYNELLEHGKVISEYPYAYKEFVTNDNEYLLSDVYISDKEYWVNNFQELPQRLFESIDKNININKSGRKELFIKKSNYKKLEYIAKQFKSSTFHVILGILFTYFGQKNDKDDFAIGLPVLNRSKFIFKKTVGLFMGVLPLRINLNFEDTFEELLQKIKKQLKKDYRYQRFPLGKLVKELGLFNEKDRLFNLTLSYEKQNYAKHFTNTNTNVIPLTHKSERVALAIYIREFDDTQDVKIDFDYNFNYFDEFKINQIVQHVENLLMGIIENPKKKLLKYFYITECEKNKILYDFNQTNSKYPKEKTILELFKNQVKKHPNKIAVEDENKQYTYAELDNISDKVANGIYIKLNKKKKSPIGILTERSANMVAIMLGVLKTGRPYIPLDPNFPKKRLKYIINHSKVQVVISQSSLNFVDFPTIVFMDEDKLIDTDLSVKEVFSKVQSFDTAYIIYTSGSTGNPKGVEIGHKSLLNFLLSIKKKPGISDGDTIYSVTTQSFDISILEFFLPLICGAKLYVADSRILKDPWKTIESIQCIRPTIIQATPSFYQMLYNAGWKGDMKLKVLCGGDLLSESLAEKLINDNAELWNMYGPTETTIWSSKKQIFKASEASNIGKPIDNTCFYILDKSLNLRPVGSIGSIYIGGHGLAKGYYKNRLHTQKNFVINPFNTSEIIYKTGDLGRWNLEGEIEFLGRNDFQVKIRGYRIELKEIEAKLDAIEGIMSSVVVVIKKNEVDSFLVAYVVPKVEVYNGIEVINKLRNELPEYMIPKTIISLENFPLTNNNKVDRKALSEKNISAYSQLEVYHPPQTELQVKLCSYFQNLLKISQKIGITDNFFECGGHSLNAIKLIHMIGEFLNYQITLKDIFDYPSVKELSYYLETKDKQKNDSIEETLEKPFYPISPSQKNIWLASQNNKKSVAYNMSAVYVIKGKIDIKKFEKSIFRTIKKYEILRTNFIEINGEPYQTIKSFDQVSFKIDVSKIKSHKSESFVEKYINQPFNLEIDLLIKIKMLEIDKKENILIFNMHHLIMDGWSLEILIKEIVSCYRVLCQKVSFKHEKLNIQFRDYVIWQQKLALNNKSKNFEFWNVYLKNYHWRPLFLNQENLINKEHQLIEHQFEWGIDFTKSIIKTAQKHNITLYTLLVSAINISLCKILNYNDICIGTLSSGRTHLDIRNQLGMFVKTLPLRSILESDMMISEFLEKTKYNLTKLDNHQDIPDKIQQNIRLDTLFVLQTPNLDYEYIEIDDLSKLVLQHEIKEYARLPVLITMIQKKDRMVGKIEFDSSKLDIESVSIMTLIYEKILEQIISNSDVSISLIDIDIALNELGEVDIKFDFD